jgi:hypothetical protein
MICKASGLLKEKTKAFSFDVERLMRLKHARNGELRSNSYTKKAPSAKRPMVYCSERVMTKEKNCKIQ